MEELRKLEEDWRSGRFPGSVRKRGIVSNEMCTSLILNILSLQLLPVNVIAYLQIMLLRNWMVRIGPILAVLVIQLAISGIWTIFCHAFHRRFFPPRELLLVYGDRSIDDILGKFSTRRDKYQVNKCMNL